MRANRKKYAPGNRSFVKLNLTRDELPKVDLLLCRDCLFHFRKKDIFLALDRIKRSGSTYLLTPINMGVTQNRDIVTGEFRRLNLQIPPFSFPKPLLLINENCPNPKFLTSIWGYGGSPICRALLLRQGARLASLCTFPSLQNDLHLSQRRPFGKSRHLTAYQNIKDVCPRR